MIVFPIINFVLPLMVTCLVLVDDPPRCSECRKKMKISAYEKNTDDFAQVSNSNEVNLNPLHDKYSKK
tara:strand:+ start:207 stop:410 length:204 start_codon:yes stop_codon:yes gene_type:complete